MIANRYCLRCGERGATGTDGLGGAVCADACAKPRLSLAEETRAFWMGAAAREVAAHEATVEAIGKSLSRHHGLTVADWFHLVAQRAAQEGEAARKRRWLR